METFKDIPGWEGCYKVSDRGRVKSLSRYNSSSTRILRPGRHPEGRQLVILCNNTKRKTYEVSRLVAIAFLDKDYIDKGLVVDHVDNNPENNNISNLKLITQRENASKDTWRIKNKSSKYVGVCWSKRANKWISGIKINGKRKHLGYFINEYDAHISYQTKLAEL